MRSQSIGLTSPSSSNRVPKCHLLNAYHDHFTINSQEYKSYPSYLSHLSPQSNPQHYTNTHTSQTLTPPIIPTSTPCSARPPSPTLPPTHTHPPNTMSALPHPLITCQPRFLLRPLTQTRAETADATTRAQQRTASVITT
jgi:hypothetical protein